MARFFAGFSSIIGGLVAIISGDWALVFAALGLSVLGMIPVSILLMPGMLIFGAISTALGDRILNATSGPTIWVAAILGTLNVVIVQIVWVFICALVLGGATSGATAPWAASLLLVGASYGVWEWLASKDIQAGNLSSSVQLSHFGLGLMLFWFVLLLAPSALLLAFALLVGAQLSSIPRLVDLTRFEAAVSREAGFTE